jgi:hypothetical protein
MKLNILLVVIILPIISFSQQNFGVNQSNPQGKVHITQSANQAALIIEDEDSDPTPFEIDSLGNVFVGGKLTTDSLQIPYGAADGAILQSDGSGNAIWNEMNIAVYQERTGGHGGASVVGWQTRNLNHTENQLGSKISVNLSSNEITLEPGVYKISVSAPCYRAEYNQIRLKDVSNSNILAYGTSHYCSAPDDAMQWSSIEQIITISVSTSFIIEHYTSSAVATYGLGLSTSTHTAETSVFTTIFIEKIK